MKRQDYSNIIVNLNYSYLADMINLDNFKFDRDNFNDVEILNAFNYYKNTKTALRLLGSILKNIEYSLELTYFDKTNYPCKSNIIYNECGCCFEGKDGFEDEELFEEVKPLMNIIMKEAKEAIKYYKEYFIRIYDRSRTV